MAGQSCGLTAEDGIFRVFRGSTYETVKLKEPLPGASLWPQPTPTSPLWASGSACRAPKQELCRQGRCRISHPFVRRREEGNGCTRLLSGTIFSHMLRHRGDRLAMAADRRRTPTVEDYADGVLRRRPGDAGARHHADRKRQGRARGAGAGSCCSGCCPTPARRTASASPACPASASRPPSISSASTWSSRATGWRCWRSIRPRRAPAARSSATRRA